MIIPAKHIKAGDRFIWPPAGAIEESGAELPEPVYVTVAEARLVGHNMYVLTRERRTMIWLQSDAEMEIERPS